MALNGYNSGYANNGRNNGNNYGNNYGQQRQQNGQKTQPYDSKPMKIEAEELPSDFVDMAEKVIQNITDESKITKKSSISTSKIRNLLSIVSDIYNVESIRKEKTMLDESVLNMTMFRIRVIYEAGREPATKSFVEKSKILNYAKSIGNDRQKLINFSHYMEALVAYHRYYLG